MRYIKFEGGTGFYGCNFIELHSFHDDVKDSELDELANEYALENGESYLNIEIDYDHKLMGKSIEAVKVVVAVDGEEIWSDNPKLEVVSTDTYSSHYSAPFEQTFEIKKGATLLIYAEATDQNGWVYRSVIEDATISDKGNALSNAPLSLESDIYDVDGNLIFKAE